ncbi:GntR family transcriptional regulator [Streptomyces albidoflavus]|uniref:GntR family transcriptional regulator n=1 Tax=Streptomyces albidoflavus TaxID=1886 RepID=UPI00101E7D40|nr:GntR family transcriptional regulator [Streptomyces albidoflavus]RZE89655.1 GntR family transcriptional regulator [Streptomyces albidoflavus]RZE91336.1 GntR family transcriptional regulator [Streptomyces albidoflavus]
MAVRSVVEQATQVLRRAILTGALAPGAEYSLRELAGMLDISFIPIREALRTLEGEGLVVMRPGRSAVVAPLGLDDLRGIYRLRRALEPEIAARSCLLLSEAELDRLAERAAGSGAVAGTDDDPHVFHLALLAPAATTWDIRVLTPLWRAGERYVRIGPGPAGHRRDGTAHGELVAAFRTRDPATVSAAVERDLARTERIALAALT